MGPCLSDETIAELVESRLDEAARSSVTAHLDQCGSCRRLVAEMAESMAVEEDEDAPLEPGAMLGRYQIKEVIGAGAMGIVYGAFDPDLGRKVALKLLRSGTLADFSAATLRSADESRERSALRERLLREARSMARLNHPNV